MRWTAWLGPALLLRPWIVGGIRASSLDDADQAATREKCSIECHSDECPSSHSCKVFGASGSVAACVWKDESQRRCFAATATARPAADAVCCTGRSLTERFTNLKAGDVLEVLPWVRESVVARVGEDELRKEPPSTEVHQKILEECRRLQLGAQPCLGAIVAAGAKTRATGGLNRKDGTVTCHVLGRDLVLPAVALRPAAVIFEEAKGDSIGLLLAVADDEALDAATGEIKLGPWAGWYIARVGSEAYSEEALLKVTAADEDFNVTYSDVAPLYKKSTSRSSGGVTKVLAAEAALDENSESSWSAYLIQGTLYVWKSIALGVMYALEWLVDVLINKPFPHFIPWLEQTWSRYIAVWELVISKVVPGIKPQLREIPWLWFILANLGFSPFFVLALLLLRCLLRRMCPCFFKVKEMRVISIPCADCQRLIEGMTGLGYEVYVWNEVTQTSSYRNLEEIVAAGGPDVTKGEACYCEECVVNYETPEQAKARAQERGYFDLGFDEVGGGVGSIALGK